MAYILVAEDDKDLRSGILYALQKEGYQTDAVGSLANLKEMLQKKPDLVLMDVSLPDGDGRSYLEHLRADSQVPVIFLTARNTERDMIRGFDAGADDYITKPFALPLLLRRIKAILRRTAEAADIGKIYRAGSLSYDFQAKILRKEEQEIHLSNTEQKLLEVFVQNANQVLTAEILLERIWDIDGNFVDKNTLSVAVARLREKIEDDRKHPKWILNVFGIGYKWSDKDAG